MSNDRNKSFMSILMEDVSLAIARHHSQPSQATQRDLVRVGFAAIEGVAWVLREHIVDWASSVIELTPSEIGALSEKSYSVNDQGKISRQPRFVPLVPMIRLVARIAERIDYQAKIDFSSPRWDQLRSAVATRNRITHPKDVTDLALSPAEVGDCMNGLFWFLEETTRVMSIANVGLRDYIVDMRKIIRQLNDGDPQTLSEYAAAAQSVQDD